MSHRLVPHALQLVLALLATVIVDLRIAAAGPTLGFREDWPGTSLDGWQGGGSSHQSNPGTGGIGGSADGFLLVSTTTLNKLGTFSMTSDYAGDWQAAGITQVHAWLRDVGAVDPGLEVHFSIGNTLNFWQYDIGLSPPSDRWSEYVIDLSSAANFTHIIGTGTYTEALQGVDRIHFRHDKAPFMQFPDSIVADFGIDHLLLTNGVVGLEQPPSVGHPVELAAPVPNPSRGPVAIVIRSTDPGPVAIDVVDAAGRSIRRVELTGGGGSRIWMWDGYDDRGRRAAPGVYRVRATGPSGGTSRSLIRVN